MLYIVLIERTVFRPFLPFPAAHYISLFERVEFNTSCSYIQTVINYNNYYLTHASEECHVFFIILLFTFLLQVHYIFSVQNAKFLKSDGILSYRVGKFNLIILGYIIVLCTPITMPPRLPTRRFLFNNVNTFHSSPRVVNRLVSLGHEQLLCSRRRLRDIVSNLYSVFSFSFLLQHNIRKQHSSVSILSR